MARRSRQGVLKRQRERKKAERAVVKREQRARRGDSESSEGSLVASQNDLAAYGLLPDRPVEHEEDRG